MSEKQSPFEVLSAINVNDHIEKKNGLSYLSWAWAVDQLMRQDPTANWAFNEPVQFGETVMVSCSVTAFDKTMTCHLPVMNYKNQAIANPDAFQVNTAMQRCLVKAIALHGLGLYIYAGEDLPEGAEKPESGHPDGKGDIPQPRATGARAATVEAFDAMDEETQAWLKSIADDVKGYLALPDVKQAVERLERENLDADEKTAIWSLFDSKQRSAIKKYQEDQRNQSKE